MWKRKLSRKEVSPNAARRCVKNSSFWMSGGLGRMMGKMIFVDGMVKFMTREELLILNDWVFEWMPR